MPPTDGYAYNRIELNAIWELEINFTEYLESWQKKFTFFDKCAEMPVEENPYREQDAKKRDLIRRAILAENENPPTPDPAHHELEQHIFLNGSCCCGAIFPSA